MGVVIDDNDYALRRCWCGNSPLRSASVNRPLVVVLFDQFLNLAMLQATFAQAVFGVSRPNESFDPSWALG
jgi:hypothetical protein